MSDTMETIARAIEVLAVVVLIVGMIVAFVPWLVAIAQRRGRATYAAFRNDLGRAILLGLEIFIVADIIHTVTVDLTLLSAATLGVIVLVRTFLSFSLEIELDGVAPWRRRETERSEP
jgi:uncharacterized membrane protein